MNKTEWPVFEVHATEGGAGKPIVLGLPFSQGRQRDAGALAVRSSSGQVRPTACRALVKWPDGSVRWALVAFNATETGRHTLEPSSRSATEPAPVRIVRDKGDASRLSIDNGLVQVAIAADGPGPIHQITALGKAVIARPGDLRWCVDQADTTREPQRKVSVLEENPVRARVRIEGAHFEAGGKRKLNYRLDVELWAGCAVLRMDYHFFNLEPGQEELGIDRIALECDLAMEDARTRRHFEQVWHGIFQQPRQVSNPDRVAIVADTERISAHVEDPAMLLDEVKYPLWLDPPLINSSDWIGVGDGKQSVYLAMQDLIQMQPKRIVSEGCHLNLEFWPTCAGRLQLPQGRSRRQVVTLAFSSEAQPSAAWIRNAMALPLWEGRASVAPEWLAACGEYEQDRVLPFGRHARFEKFFSRMVALSMPQEMFDLGDTPESGYHRSYTTQGINHERLLPGAPVMPRIFTTNGSGLAPWCILDHYESIWTNNEYDAIHAFACELMRTGKPNLWPTLRWLVRHNIEVDFIHYNDEQWLNRISPAHSARHSSSGGYPSHFWTQGLLEYYCMTGDADVREVAEALGDAIIRFFHDPERGKFYTNFDRENGWSLLALVHLYDVTREERFKREIDRLCEFVLAQPFLGNDPEQGYFALSYVRAFYFVLNYIEGLDLYQRITGRQDLADWLVRALRPMIRQIPKLFREGGSAHSTPAAMAIGFERTGDAGFLKAGMISVEELTQDDPRWLHPILEIKSMAVLYRAYIRFLGHAQRAGLLDTLDYRGLQANEAAPR
jgi:hypothetical protein